jgi:hypothetical protein
MPPPRHGSGSTPSSANDWAPDVNMAHRRSDLTSGAAVNTAPRTCLISGHGRAGSCYREQMFVGNSLVSSANYPNEGTVISDLFVTAGPWHFYYTVTSKSNKDPQYPALSVLALAMQTQDNPEDCLLLPTSPLAKQRQNRSPTTPKVGSTCIRNG